MGVIWQCYWGNSWFLGPFWFEPTIQTASWSVQPFSHSWPQSVPILYNGPPFPRICPFPWRSGSPSKTWFIGPSRAHKPNVLSRRSLTSAHLLFLHVIKIWQNLKQRSTAKDSEPNRRRYSPVSTVSDLKVATLYRRKHEQKIMVFWQINTHQTDAHLSVTKMA